MIGEDCSHPPRGHRDDVPVPVDDVEVAGVALGLAGEGDRGLADGAVGRPRPTPRPRSRDRPARVASPRRPGRRSGDRCRRSARGGGGVGGVEQCGDVEGIAGVAEPRFAVGLGEFGLSRTRWAPSSDDGSGSASSYPSRTASAASSAGPWPQAGVLAIRRWRTPRRRRHHPRPEARGVRDREDTRVVGARRVPVGARHERGHRLGDEPLRPPVRTASIRASRSGPCAAAARRSSACAHAGLRGPRPPGAAARRAATARPRTASARGRGRRPPRRCSPARDGGDPVAGVADRGPRTSRPPTSRVAQQQEPGVEGTGDRRGQGPRAGHPVESLRAVRRRRRPGGAGP